MIIITGHDRPNCYLSSCIVTDEDRSGHTCGLCLSNGVLGQPHDAGMHTQVRLPGEEYEVVTTRYVMWGEDYGYAWAEGFETVRRWLAENAYIVVASRRTRKVEVA